MDNSPDSVQKRLDRRQWARDFALVVVLVALALAVSSLLADLSAKVN